MKCDLWQDKIDAFVDSELTPAQQHGFEDHLRECPACAAETLARQRLKIETRLAGQRFTPSPEFESKVFSRVARPRFSPRMWLVGAAAVMAVAIVGILSVSLWRQNLTRQQLLSRLTDQHVATLASSNPVDVISSDSHTVKPWFQGKVPFSVELPVLEGSDFTLVGGRLTYFQQDPVAHLVFGLRRHRISVFIFRERAESAALGNSTVPSKKMGFQTATWTEDGLRYFIIGDVTSADLQRLCELLLRTGQS